MAIPQCVQIAVDCGVQLAGKLAALLSSGENLIKLIDGALGVLKIVKQVLTFIGEQPGRRAGHRVPRPDGTTSSLNPACGDRASRYGRRVSFSSRVLVVASVVGLALVSAPPVSGEPRPGELVHIAGVAERWGYSGDGGDARLALLGGGDLPVAVAADGTVYIADELNEAVRVVSADGVISTLPVTYDEDTWARPRSVALDGAGVLHIATGSTVRRHNPDGTTTVVAGGGAKSFDFDGTGDGGDGGPATAARLGGVHDFAFGPDGSMYLAESVFDRVRRVAPDGTITTVAGGGVAGSVLDSPQEVTVAPDGTVYFTQLGFRDVQRIAADGSISTVLGQNREPGFSGDGGPAAEAGFEAVGGLATDPEGNLYVADPGNQVVRVIDPRGVIDTVGSRVPAVRDVAVGPNGDLYLTTNAQIKRLVRGRPEAAGGEVLPRGPARWADQDAGTVLPVVGAGRGMTSSERTGGGSGPLAAAPDGTVYYADDDHRVMALRPDGTSEVYAGSSSGFAGDGGPADKAKLYEPEALAVDQDGTLYIADAWNFRVRKVDAEGTITTVAGKDGELSVLDEGPNGDGGPATEASIMPSHLAPGPDGSLFVVDQYSGGRIRKIDSQGIITSIAGGGERAENDTNRASEVSLDGRLPESLAVDGSGAVYFTLSGQVHRVTADGALAAVTAAGTGFAGDGGPAAQAILNSPRGLAMGSDGTLYIADADNNLVRAVRPDGVMTTVAGSGVREDSAEGLLQPVRVAVDDARNVYVTTADTARIRRIDADGKIETVAELGLVVDGSPAAEVAVESPSAVAVDPAGTVFVGGDGPVIAAGADDKVRSVMDVPYLSGLAAGPDGSVYVPTGGRVDRIHPDGATVTVAGVGVMGRGDGPLLPDVDGKPAASSMIDPREVAISPAGELYLTSGSRVYRVDEDGLLRLVVDLKDADESADSAEVWVEIAVTRDGAVYLAESQSGRVFVADGEGGIRAFAGNGEYVDEDRGDGDDATDVALAGSEDLVVAPDGTVYIATREGVRRVSTDGEIDTVAELQDGESPTALALDAHGNLYFTVADLNRVFVVVRPGELAQPFPWGVLWWSLAAVALLGAVAFRVLRRRRAPAPAGDGPVEPAPAE